MKWRVTDQEVDKRGLGEDMQEHYQAHKLNRRMQWIIVDG